MQPIVRILVLLFCSVSLNAAVYYVRTDGNDSNTGTNNTAGAAWLTIQKAANTMVAGDTVRVQPGTYTENLTETTSGSSGNFITYLADGDVGEVIIDGKFYIEADYIRIVGFEITTSIYPVSGFYGIRLANGSDYCQVLNNYIHHVSGIGIQCSGTGIMYGGTANIYRYNRIEYPAGVTGHMTGEAAINASGNNIVVEYNSMMHVGDYTVLRGTNVVFRGNYCGPNNPADFPEYFPNNHHVDVVQWSYSSNALPLFRGQFEGNLVHSNLTSDGHGWLFQNNIDTAPGVSDVSRYATWRNNAFYTMGTGAGGFAPFEDGYAIQNTVVIAGVSNLVPAAFNSHNRSSVYSTNSHFVGNLFHSAVSQAGYGPWNYESATDKTGTYANHNVRYLSNDPEDAEAHGTEADPQLVSYSTGVLFPTNTSPAIGHVTSLTTANGAGTNATSLVIHSNVTYFCDGFGMVDGDWIAIGTGNPVQITDVDDATSTITLAAARSWSDDDSIWFADPTTVHKDAGAYPYRSGGWTSAATYEDNGDGTADVAVDPALVRMIVVFNDHLPSDPYYVDSTNEVVTVSGTYEIRAYPRYAPNSYAELYDVAAESDFTAPVISSVVSTPNSQTTCTVTWSLDESCTNAVYCSEDESWTNSVSSAVSTTSPSLQLTSLKASTTYNVYVFSQDAYGNSSTNRATDFTTLSPATDPTLDRVQDSGKTAHSGAVKHGQ